MKSVGLAAAMLLAAATAAPGDVLGGFGNSRLLNATYNLADGASMSNARAAIADAGFAVVLTEETLTAEFLDTLDVFVTSQIALALPTPEEVLAMADWVQRGGVLIVTADCA